MDQAKLDADREESKALQKIMEIVLALNEKMHANTKAMEEIFARTERKATSEMTTATPAKTDVKLEELTGPRDEMMQSVE
jgi:hypothetical protein